MNKPVFGLLLGGILGIFDGLSALVSAPETAPQIVGIVIGSTVKGLMAGILIGFFSRKVNSLPLGILFGLIVGALLAFWVAYMQGKYYLEIMLPGSVLGIIVGYATQKYGTAPRKGSPSTTAALLLALALLAPAGARAGEAPAKVDAKSAFETLKGLAGEWKGTIMEENGDPGAETYEVTAGGNLVLERMFPGTEHEMINAYYLQGDELRVVHYCMVGNRPEMKLDPASSKPGDLVFVFAGGTGFDAAKDNHVHAGRLVLAGDRLTSQWTFYNGGKETGSAKFLLKRAAASPAR
ncbi:MAG TPA: hypothetical protein VF756_15190 [Thermoanaerobaculia bacterium]